MSASVSVQLEGLDATPSMHLHEGTRHGLPLSAFIHLHSASIWGYDAAAFRRLADCATLAAEALEAAATPPPTPEPVEVGEARPK